MRRDAVKRRAASALKEIYIKNGEKYLQSVDGIGEWVVK